MKAFWPLMFVAFYSLSANAWGPGVDDREIATTAQFGSNFFMQTVMATGHFGATDQSHNNYFLLQERPELAKTVYQQERSEAEARKSMDLSWFIGYAFYQSSALDPVSAAQVTDSAHSLKIGLDWELAQRANFVAAGGYELLPAENYSQGIFELALTYTIPLNEECPIDENQNDSEQYYVAKAKYEECPKHGAKDRFPNIELGVLGNYNEHTKSPTSSGRTAGASTAPAPLGLGSDTQLNEASSGPQIVLNLNRNLSFKGKLLIYIYDNPPANILQYTTIGGFRPKANLAVADMQDTTAILLVFPKRTLAGSMDLHLTDSINLQGELAYSSWDATTSLLSSSSSSVAAGLVSSTVSFGAIIDFAFAQRWKASGSLDFTSGTGYSASTFGLGLAYGI